MPSKSRATDHIDADTLFANWLVGVAMMPAPAEVASCRRLRMPSRWCMFTGCRNNTGLLTPGFGSQRHDLVRKFVISKLSTASDGR